MADSSGCGGADSSAARVAGRGAHAGQRGRHGRALAGGAAVRARQQARQGVAAALRQRRQAELGARGVARLAQQAVAREQVVGLLDRLGAAALRAGLLLEHAQVLGEADARRAQLQAGEALEALPGLGVRHHGVDVAVEDARHDVVGPELGVDLGDRAVVLAGAAGVALLEQAQVEGLAGAGAALFALFPALEEAVHAHAVHVQADLLGGVAVAQRQQLGEVEGRDVDLLAGALSAAWLRSNCWKQLGHTTTSASTSCSVRSRSLRRAMSSEPSRWPTRSSAPPQHCILLG